MMEILQYSRLNFNKTADVRKCICFGQRPNHGQYSAGRKCRKVKIGVCVMFNSQSENVE